MGQGTVPCPSVFTYFGVGTGDSSLSRFALGVPFSSRWIQFLFCRGTENRPLSHCYLSFIVIAYQSVKSAMDSSLPLLHLEVCA